ncbi:MAG: 2-oxoacid:acceptor oxidoreductase family protein [Ruminococcus sp.]|nr:2-oxoacid:acceptor oxidoreductase family protein [Ruminococcus sp.]
MNIQIILAGFGGQGILFAGKVLAYCAMTDGRKLTWLPSYGPEMRGGTANCSVCISDEEIGSPVIQNPDALIVMNGPSLEKFKNDVKSGGLIIADGSIIKEDCDRSDVEFIKIDASDIAAENDLGGGANMVLLGKFLEKTKLFTQETVSAALKKCVSPKRAELIPRNLKALSLGGSF